MNSSQQATSRRRLRGLAITVLAVQTLLGCAGVPEAEKSSKNDLDPGILVTGSRIPRRDHTKTPGVTAIEQGDMGTQMGAMSAGKRAVPPQGK